MNATRRRLGPVAALLVAALVGGLLALCVVHIPAGHVGVAGTSQPPRRVLSAGFHLRRPLDRLDLYPVEPLSFSGRAEAITREGSRQPLLYELTARVDAGRAAMLPPRAFAGRTQEVFGREMERLVRAALESPAAAGALPVEGIQEALHARGFIVERLDVRSAGSTGIASSHRLAHPIVLIGLDGADWQIIDPMMKRGLLPHLASLKMRSAWGPMRSFEPILSPLLWTTVVTGKPPDEHGIIDFLVPDPATGRKIPITSRSRKVRALWNIFGDAGLTSDIVAWWATWPAEAIDGRIVSDRVAYSLFDVEAAGSGLTYPEELWHDLAPLVVPAGEVSQADLSRFVDVNERDVAQARAAAAANPKDAYRHPVNHLSRIIAGTRSYHAIALRLLRDRQPDLFAVYYQGIDEVSHRFAHFMPPRMSQVSEADFARYQRAVEAFYIWQDELLGELLGAIADDATVIVLSDHGFHNGSSRPADEPADIEGKPGRWHRLYGIVMVAGEGIAPGAVDGATLNDVAPTVLALAGLPLARDMKGSPLVRRGTAASGEEPARIATYEDPSKPHAQGAVTPAGTAAADEELLRNLESLGYIGGAQGSPGERDDAEVPAATVTAHTNLAAALVQKGDLAGAEKELEAALARVPGYFPALMSLARVLVKQGRIEEAFDATRRALTATPRPDPQAFVQMALLASRAESSAVARRLLDDLEAKGASPAAIGAARGVLSEEAGRLDEAERFYRAALASDPAFADPLGRLFALYRGAGKEAALHDLVRRGLEANDLSVLHHNWLGLILERRGDPRGAEREFRRALEIAPDFAGTMANLGSFYGRAGRLDDAVTVLARAVRIEPANLEARVNLGAALAKLGRLDEAIANLEEARGLGLRSAELLNAVGLAYAETGRAKDAIRALEESLRLRPDQPQVQALLRELRPGA